MNAIPIGAHRIAQAIGRGEMTAQAIVSETLHQLDVAQRSFNLATSIFHLQALADARAIDEKRARGETLGPLAGVPIGVKDLFDIKGVVTLAGSRCLRDNAPAALDATAVEKLRAADAVIVAALNMDEFAYGFVTENHHYGATKNPHDTARICGGSSGGSACAIAANVLPITLGTDTNGSIRVPASLSGVFGLKPTYGRLSRAGAYPFVASFDHIGPFARTSADLALAYNALQGFDPRDPVSAAMPKAPIKCTSSDAVGGLRIARADGYFLEHAEPYATGAVNTCASALGSTRIVSIADAALARAAAFLITASEGGALHLDRLRTHAEQYDPATRDRLIAGTMMPAAWPNRAQRFRARFRATMAALFETVDVLLLPATPCVATQIGQTEMQIREKTVPVRASMGLLTQPISFIGLPVLTVPLPNVFDGMPLGVQIVAPPWREDWCFVVAAALESLGVARSQ
jgi:1-carboxybiuret hydrolase